MALWSKEPRQEALSRASPSRPLARPSKDKVTEPRPLTCTSLVAAPESDEVKSIEANLPWPPTNSGMECKLDRLPFILNPPKFRLAKVGKEEVELSGKAGGERRGLGGVGGGKVGHGSSQSRGEFSTRGIKSRSGRSQSGRGERTGVGPRRHGRREARIPLAGVNGEGVSGGRGRG